MGDRVRTGDVIAEIMADHDAVVERVRDELAACITIGQAQMPPKPRVRAMVDSEGQALVNAATVLISAWYEARPALLDG